VIRAISTGLAALCALAAGGSAQLATSPGYTLEAVSLGGAGGGTGSPGTAVFAAQEPASDDEPLASASFQLEVGFLTRYDLESGEPGLFDVSPASGPIAGGTPITLSGLHFDRGGTAGVVTVDVGGQPASSVVVVSDTTLTAVTPPGSYGPADVTVSTALGSAVRAGGHVFTPGLVTSPVAWQTGTLRIANHGPLGASFQTQFSTVATSIPLPPFGTLLIGPAPILDGVPITPYPASGLSEVIVPIPTSPSAAGTTLHFQTAAILSFAPLDVQLLNRQSVLLQ